MADKPQVSIEEQVALLQEWAENVKPLREFQEKYPTYEEEKAKVEEVVVPKLREIQDKLGYAPEKGVIPSRRGRRKMTDEEKAEAAKKRAAKKAGKE